MDTLTDLQNAIGNTTDVYERADLWMNAGARQTDLGNFASAVSMLNNARDLVANFFEIGVSRDAMIGGIAFQYARARDTTKAQNALQYITNTTIADETRARIAIEASKINITTAQTIINTIQTTTIKDDAIIDVCYERARLGELNQALAYAENIADAGKIESTKNQCKRLASAVISQ